MASIGLRVILAEAQRFELWPGVTPLPVFKTSPFSHLGTPPARDILDQIEKRI